ncbi:VWA domain-containing protein [Pararhizobium sp. IMCC21322]|uniref:vWA domain-containing protein n=1 Tax=Pararhizobium sp. IMCC21322 TaxID=3067903 RepID=UPI002741C58A|nr:VWA domain-containing protein [Pararhizobium sp. IMCC21322]
MSARVATDTGHFADNIVHFARLLRRAGLPVGPSRIVDAVRAVEVSGTDRRDDLYWVLHSVFASRNEHHAIFKTAFELFWRSQESQGNVWHSVSKTDAQTPPQNPAAAARVAQAMMQQGDHSEVDLPVEVELDLAETLSREEVLVTKDFAQMTAYELAEARRAVSDMVLPVAKVKTRRFRNSHSGSRLDMRRMMRASLATGGEWVSPTFQQRREIVPPIVALCDVSGSMGQYSRLFLHFLHALGDSQRRVDSFVFGTRLTNISRALLHKDSDEALEASGALVSDWSGGTRIATALHDFNQHWSRRVLGQGAIVLLITDGLERDSDEDLGFEMQRLQKSCRQLIWLNPLLRFDGFEAKASGVRTMLPFVDQFRPIHSLNAVSDLCHCLSQPLARAENNPKLWLKKAA